MLLKTGGVAASLALVADAFLVPSTISLPKPEGRAGPFGIDVGVLHPEIHSRTARLECPGCPALKSHQSTSLLLEFSTSSDGNVLELNGEPFWPVTAAFGGRTPQAIQVSSDVATADVQSKGLDAFETNVLGISSVVRMRHTSAADGSEAQIHDLDMTILEVGGQPVNIDGLSIRLLTDEYDNIAIIDIIDVPSDKDLPAFDGIQGHPDSSINADGCQGFFKYFCEAQKYAKAKMEQMQHRRPCPGKKMNRPNLPLKGGIPKFTPFFGQPSEHSDDISEYQGYPQFNEHMEEQFHSFTHKVASALHHFLVGFVVPVMIGIVAGMTASLLGMIVGTAIAWVWIKVVRGGKRGNVSGGEIVLVHGEDIAVVGEKEALLTEATEVDEESLPAYHEPPQYSEKE